MTTSTYKDIVLLLVTIGMVLLVVGHCNENKKHAVQITEYDNLVAELEADRLLILDSVDILNEQLKLEREALPKRLNDYSKLPTKERIKLITKIDTMAITTDTMAILSIHGIDSINKLTIHYQSCMVQSAIKDTTIKHLTNVVEKDSVYIDKQNKEFEDYKQKEASRNKKSYWRGFKHGSGVATGFFAVIKAVF